MPLRLAGFQVSITGRFWVSTEDLPLHGAGGTRFQSVWQRALGYRAALVRDPKLHLLSVDFLTCALFGGGDFIKLWLQFLRPDPDAFVRLAETMSSAASRIMSLPQLVMQLSADDEELRGLLRLLIELGFADALRPGDLVWAFKEPGLLARAERVAWLPHEAPINSPPTSLPEQETIHPGQSLALAHVAEVYASGIVQAFCTTGSHRLSLEDLYRMTVTLMSRLQAMPGPALEIACLSLTRAVWPRFRDAVLPGETEETVSISVQSPVGQLWSAVWRWAEGDERRRAALSRAVTAQLCAVDQLTWPRSPAWRHVAALLLGSRIEEVSACLSILSANWHIRPMEQQETSVDFKGLANWEEVLRQGALALDRGEQLATDNDRGTWWITISHGEHKGHYEMPAEAVLLRTEPKTITRLGPALALDSPDRDGRIYHLLIELSAHPEDPERRRVLARLAAEAPWRLMRQSPLWLQRWPALAHLPESPLPANITDLRAMLCERDPLPRNPDLALLHERTANEAPWGCWPGLIEQASLVPGIISATALRSFLDGPHSVSWVCAILGRLTNPQDHPAAQVARDLLSLGMAATEQPIVSTQTSQNIDLRNQLPRFMEQSLRDAVERENRSPLDDGASFAEHEPGLLRLCARIISALSWLKPLEIRDGLWLSYRLYQWYAAQLMSISKDARAIALRELAPAYPSSISALDTQLDLFHPFRLGAEGTSYRLLTLLYAISLGTVLSQLASRDSPDSQPTTWLNPYRATSPSLEALLADLAARPLTAGELQMKSQALTQIPSILGWSKGDPLSVPELALVALLSRRQHAFGEMPLPIRIAWIKRLPKSGQDPEAIAWSVTDQLLQAASLRAANLHEEERSVLRERSALLLQYGQSWVPEDYQRPILLATWICRIRLYEAGEKELAGELETFFQELSDLELSRALLPHYLVAVAEVALSSLESVIRQVLEAVQRRGGAPTLWMQALEQVIQSGSPAAQKRAQHLLSVLA